MLLRVEMNRDGDRAIATRIWSFLNPLPEATSVQAVKAANLQERVLEIHNWYRGTTQIHIADDELRTELSRLGGGRATDHVLILWRDNVDVQVQRVAKEYPDSRTSNWTLTLPRRSRLHILLVLHSY